MTCSRAFYRALLADGRLHPLVSRSDWLVVLSELYFLITLCLLFFFFQSYFYCCHIFQTGRMDDASINLEFSIVGDMINYYQWLFSVSLQNVMYKQSRFGILVA